MDQIWIMAVAAIAVVTLAVPFAAVVLVSIASRREEAEHSLSRQAPGAITRAARRLLSYRADQLDQAQGWPVRDAGRTSRDRRSGRSGSDLYAFDSGTQAGRSPGGPAGHEVRFGHARRPVSDPGQYPASRQPQPRSVRADQRQGAGV